MYAEFRPEAVSFVIFFALLYLMKRKDLSSKVFFMCFSLLGASLLLVHFPEFAVLLLALSFVSVFVSGNSFRAKDALYSCFLSILIALVVSISWQLLGFSALSPPYLLCMGLATTSAAILGLSSLLKALYINRNLTSWKITSRTRFGIFLILIAVHVLAIISWLDQLNSYDYSSVAESTFIPWFFYPVILGIVPLLAFSCLVFKPTKTSKILSFMAIFVIVPLVLSLVNNFMTISFVTPPMYANYRLLRVPFVVMTLMASFALVSLHDRISEALRRKRRDFMLVSLLSLIVVGGLSSTFLSTPTSYAWAETYKINEKEYGAVTSLREIIAKNPYASVFTASELSTYVVQLATPLSTFMFGNPIRFQLSSPVTTTIMLNEFAPSKVFVYMHDRDKAYFSSSSYLGHLLEHSEQVVNFSGGTIYELPSLIEPQQNAPTVLATSSEENSSSTYFIYDQLLLSNINFTTMDEEDPGIFQAKNIILLSDPSNSTKDNYLLSKYLRFAQNGGQILVLNSEGFGCFSSLNDLGKQLQEKNCTVVKYQLGKGRIIYLNIYPLMQSESAEENQLINISENILRQMNLPKLTNDDSLKGLLENNVAFKEAQLEGNVSILTDSVIFKSMSGTISIEAEESNYSISQNEVRYLVVEGHDAVKVHTEGLSIVAGEAFYSTMKVTNPSLIYSGKNVSLTMVMNDGSIKNINAGRIVLSLSGDTELLVRNPSIQMKNGIATLKEVYDVYPPAEMSITPFASLFSGKRPLSSVLLEGQNTTIAGDVNLKINLNDDIFTFSYVDYKGILQREPPILMWNEIGSLAKSLKYLPFILVFFLAVWIIRSQYNLRRAHSKGGRQEE
jgi:hypothetical protein